MDTGPSQYQIISEKLSVKWEMMDGVCNTSFACAMKHSIHRTKVKKMGVWVIDEYANPKIISIWNVN